MYNETCNKILLEIFTIIRGITYRKMKHLITEAKYKIQADGFKINLT